MSSPYSESQVRLYRDALSTPWGFRLQGGADFKAPLTVQRVFVGSPADGTLSRGDVIASIENYDASRMIHKQAMDIVKRAGGNLLLSVRRSASAKKTAAGAPPKQLTYRSRPPDKQQTPVSPQRVPEFGMDYGYQNRFQPQQNQVSHHGLGYQHKGPPETMLNKLQRSLNTSLWNGEEADPEYEYKAVGDLRKEFGDRIRATQQQRKPASVGAGPIWQKPHPSTITSRPPAGLVEPGWTPTASACGWSPVKPPGTGHHAPPPPTQHVQAPQPVHRPAPQPTHHQAPHHQAPHHQAPHPVNIPRPVNARPQPQLQHIAPGHPAWAGSLKSSGGPKPWEMREAEMISKGGPSGVPPAPQEPVNVHQPRVQTVTYGPGGGVQSYGQHDPAAHGPSDTAQVRHLQYNSPLGLYSKDNVQDALSGQTSGRPGEGTLNVSGGRGHKSFDPDRSDVLRLLQEEETIKHKQRGYGLRPAGAPAHSARYEDQVGEMNYHGYLDHDKKSPAMARLEYNLASGEVGADAQPHAGEGTSDF